MDMQREAAAVPERLDARACTSTYVIFCGIFGFLFALGIFAGRVPGGYCRITLATAVAFLLSIFWVKTFRLQYSDGLLSYRTLFSGTRSIALSDIEKVETQLISAGKGRTRVLMIYPRPELMKKPIQVNIKVFSREDVGRVFDLLGPKFKSSRRIGAYTNEGA